MGDKFVVKCINCGFLRKVKIGKSRSCKCFRCGKSFTFKPKKAHSRIKTIVGERSRIWQEVIEDRESRKPKIEELDFYSYKYKKD